MKKIIKIKTKLILIVLSVLLLNAFLGKILNILDIENAEIYYLLKISSKILIITIIFILIKKYHYSIRNKYKIIITAISIATLYYALTSLQSEISETINITKNLLFLISCLSVAVFEELFFRVFIYKFLKEKGYASFKLIVVPSLLFGVAHFSSLFSEGVEVFSVINQVVFAFGIGLVLQTVYVKSKSITICVIIHALINYYGSYKSGLLNFNNLTESIDSESIYTFNDFLATFITLTLIIVVIILPISYFLQRRRKVI